MNQSNINVMGIPFLKFLKKCFLLAVVGCIPFMAQTQNLTDVNTAWTRIVPMRSALTGIIPLANGNYLAYGNNGYTSDATVSPDIQQNYAKSNANEVYLAEFTEAGTIVRKKTIKYTLANTEYRRYITHSRVIQRADGGLLIISEHEHGGGMGFVPTDYRRFMRTILPSNWTETSTPTSSGLWGIQIPWNNGLIASRLLAMIRTADGKILAGMTALHGPIDYVTGAVFLTENGDLIGGASGFNLMATNMGSLVTIIPNGNKYIFGRDAAIVHESTNLNCTAFNTFQNKLGGYRQYATTVYPLVNNIGDYYSIGMSGNMNQGYNDPRNQIMGWRWDANRNIKTPNPYWTGNDMRIGGQILLNPTGATYDRILTTIATATPSTSTFAVAKVAEFKFTSTGVTPAQGNPLVLPANTTAGFHLASVIKDGIIGGGATTSGEVRMMVAKFSLCANFKVTALPDQAYLSGTTTPAYKYTPTGAFSGATVTSSWKMTLISGTLSSHPAAVAGTVLYSGTTASAAQTTIPSQIFKVTGRDAQAVISVEYTAKQTYGTPAQICNTTGQFNIIIQETPDNIIDPGACVVNFDKINFNVKQQWSVQGGHQNTGPLVGDLDGDGLPEIVVFAENRLSISILNGQNGALKASIAILATGGTGGWYPHMTAVMVDADRNGKGELIIAKTDKTITSYEAKVTSGVFSMVTKWTSATLFDNPTADDNVPQPIVTDFNGDGVPELLVYNKIYNAVTGVYLGETEPIATAFVGRQPNFTHNKAVNFISTADMDGDGLPEIIAGGKVYKVNFNASKTSLTCTKLYHNTSIGDGYTAVADIDMDGFLDVVVTNSKSSATGDVWMHVWSPIKNTMIAQFEVYRRATYAVTSFPFIGDIDGVVNATTNKKHPEICITIRKPDGDLTTNAGYVRAYKYNPSGGTNKMSLKWTLPTTDESGGTGITLFDFNNDGINELVYRDQTLLRILNGRTDGVAPVLADAGASFACASGTALEFPVIADTDGDGSANICVTCAASYGGTPNYVRVYESGSTPWAPTRKVWNQVNYQPLQINNDLTVPKFSLPKNTAFSGKYPYNGSLIQVPIVDINFNPVVEAADPSISVSSVTVACTNATTTRVSIVVKNIGKLNTNINLPVAVYKTSAVLANFLATKPVGVALVSGAQTTMYIDIPTSSLVGIANIVVRIQDNGVKYPADGSYLDCDYANNTVTKPLIAPIVPAVTAAAICYNNKAVLKITNAAVGVLYSVFTTTTGGTAVVTGTPTAANVATFSLTVPTNILVNTNYYVEAKNTNGCFSTARKAVTVTVYALPTLPTITAAPVCVGVKPVFFMSDANMMFDYIIYNPAGAAVTSVMSPTVNGSFTMATVNTEATGTASTAGTKVYKVEVRNRVTKCINTKTVDVVVNPLPVLTAPGNKAFCVGAAAVTFVGTGVDGTKCTWTNSNTAIGLAASGTGNLSFNATNATNAPIVATIVVTAKSALGCTGLVKQTFTITINPTPVFTQPVNQAICVGSKTGVVTFAGTNIDATKCTWTNSNTAIGLAASGTGNIPAFTTTNTGTTPLVATITVTPKSSTSCAAATKKFTITVNPLPVLTAPGNKAFCVGAAAVTFGGTNVDGTKCTWTNSNTAIGLPATGTGNLSFTATNATNAAITATVVVTAKSTAGCTGVAKQTFTITINPTPILPTTITAAAVCVGVKPVFVISNANVAYEYIIYNPAGVAASNYETPPANGSFTIQTFNAEATGTASTAGTKVYKVEVRNKTTLCVNTKTVNVVVNPLPVLTAPGNKAFCVGAAAVTFAGTNVDGTKCTWTNSNTAIGLPATGTGNLSFTATNATNAPITATIVVTPKSTAGCTGLVKQTFTITINPTPVLPTTITATAVCVGVKPAIVISNANTAYEYIIYNPAGVAASNYETPPANGSFTIQTFNAEATGTASTAGTKVYKVEVRNKTTKCINTKTVNVVVNPLPVLTAPGNKAFCVGAATVTFGGTNVDASKCTWTNSNTAIGLPATGTGNLSFTATNATNAPITATIVVTAKSTAGCTGLATQTFTITINPTPVLPTTITATAVCVGVKPAIVISNANTAYEYIIYNPAGVAASNYETPPANGSFTIQTFNAEATGTASTAGTKVYKVEVRNKTTLCVNTKTVNVVVNLLPVLTAPGNKAFCVGAAAVTFGGTNVDGTKCIWTNSNTAIGLAASGTGNLSFNATNGTNAPIVATIVVTAKSALGCTGLATQTFTITINPTPVFTQPTNQAICVGSSTSATFAGTNIDPTKCTWTNSNTAIGLAASGTGNIPAFTTTNTGTTPLVATITVTPKSSTSCVAATKTFTITVNPLPVLTAPGNKAFCVGAASVIFAGTNVDGTKCTWTNSNTAIGLAASGTGNLSFTATNATNAPIVATIVVTAKSTAGCTGLVTQSFTITINPTPVLTQPANQAICVGSSTSAVFAGTNIDPTKCTWTNSNTAIGLAASGTGNIPAFTTTNTGTTPLVATITVTPKSSTSCVAATKTFTITVNPLPVLTAPGNKAFCVGAVAVTFAGSNVDASKCTWTNSNTAIGLPATGTGNLSFTATNATNAPIVATIVVTPKSTVGCTGLVTQSFTITINPTPVLTQPANQAICVGSSTSAVFAGTNIDPTKCTWTNSNTAIGLAASGTGNIPAFTTTNTGTTPLVATITVTPKSSTSCVAATKTFTITVNPLPVLTAPGNKAFCVGAAAVTFAGTNVDASKCTWTNSNTAIGLPATGTGNLSFTATNATNAPIVATIVVTAKSTAGCTGLVTQSFTITINPTPVLTQPANQAICVGSSTSAVFAGTNIDPTKCTWTNSNTAIGLAASGTGNIPAFTTINTGTTPLVATITVTPKSGTNCVAVAKTFTITVNPTLTATAAKVDITCNGANSGKITVTATGGSGAYQYSIDNKITWQTSNVFSNLAPGSYTIHTKDDFPCPAPILTATITEQAIVLLPANVSSPLACPNILSEVHIKNSLAGVSYSVYDAPTGGTQQGVSMPGNGGLLVIYVGIQPVSTTLYVETKSNGGTCVSVSRIPLSIVVRDIVSQYPDIRIQICPVPNRTINLSSYLDTTYFHSVNWTTASVGSPALTNSTGSASFQTNQLNGTHAYYYTLSNACYTNVKAKVYVNSFANTPHKRPGDTIVVCRNTSNMNLNQVLGLDAKGKWLRSTDYNPYLGEVTPPSIFSGAFLLDVKAAYTGLQGTTHKKGYRTDPTAVHVNLKYSTMGVANSCWANKERDLVIIITSTQL